MYISLTRNTQKNEQQSTPEKPEIGNINSNHFHHVY